MELDSTLERRLQLNAEILEELRSKFPGKAIAVGQEGSRFRIAVDGKKLLASFSEEIVDNVHYLEEIHGAAGKAAVMKALIEAISAQIK